MASYFMSVAAGCGQNIRDSRTRRSVCMHILSVMRCWNLSDISYLAYSRLTSGRHSCYRALRTATDQELHAASSEASWDKYMLKNDIFGNAGVNDDPVCSWSGSVHFGSHFFTSTFPLPWSTALSYMKREEAGTAAAVMETSANDSTAVAGEPHSLSIDGLALLSHYALESATLNAAAVATAAVTTVTAFAGNEGSNQHAAVVHFPMVYSKAYLQQLFLPLSICLLRHEGTAAAEEGVDFIYLAGDELCVYLLMISQRTGSIT
jgi:hypothetical protein